jgi:hypothetical protein
MEMQDLIKLCGQEIFMETYILKVQVTRKATDGS